MLVTQQKRNEFFNFPRRMQTQLPIKITPHSLHAPYYLFISMRCRLSLWETNCFWLHSDVQHIPCFIRARQDPKIDEDVWLGLVAKTIDYLVHKERSLITL